MASIDCDFYRSIVYCCASDNLRCWSPELFYGFNRELFEAQAAKEGISPEEVRTRMNTKVVAGFPLGRLGTPEDVANMVAFLASDESSFITGQSINVNGGAFTAL